MGLQQFIEELEASVSSAGFEEKAG